MRIGPAIHGVLLTLALVFAYKTWTRDKTEPTKAGEIVVWNESADAFESLTFTTKNKEVLVERRADDAGTYLWGKVTKTRKKVKKGEVPPHGMGGHGGHGGHGHGAPPPAPAPKDGAKPDAKAPEKGPAKPEAKKPAAKTPAAKKPAAKKPAAKKPAVKKDGKKTDQNDQIPDKQKKPLPPKAAPKKAEPKKAEPKKPTPAKPADAKPAAGGPEAAPDTATPAPAPKMPAPEPEGETETTIRQFPVGDAGDEMLANFSAMRALRELGTPNEDEKIDFGLDDAEDTIVVRFKGGVERKLLVGDRVYGGSDRYVLDEASGKGYVIASAVMKHLDSAETSLGLKKYNDFDLKEELQQITVDVDGASQTLVRLEMEDPKKKTPRLTWARKEAPTEEDVTMANFIDRASKLRPTEYLPELNADSLTLLARFEYGDKAGKPIGYLDFYKGVDPKAKDPTKEEYFMKTERTRVLGKVSKLTAERVDQDLREVFGTSEEPAPVPGDTPGTPTE